MSMNRVAIIVAGGAHPTSSAKDDDVLWFAVSFTIVLVAGRLENRATRGDAFVMSWRH